MAIDFKLPDLGENIESGDVVSVLVKEGQSIDANQNVLEIETGKAVVELPCPHAGKITKLHVKKGSKVKVGDSLLSIEGSAPAAEPKAKKDAPAGRAAQDAPAKQEKRPAKAAAEPAAEEEATAEDDGHEAANDRPKQAAKSKVKSNGAEKAGTEKAGTEKAGAEKAGTKRAKTAAPSHRTPPAGPATRRLARELGVDLTRVSGTGPGGRITEEDVKSAVRHSTGGGTRSPALAVPTASLPEGTDDRDNWGPIRRQPMTKIRHTIAVNMARSASTIPHVTNFDDADVTELERIRKSGMADYVDSSVKLTMMAFVMKAVAQSLRLHPMLNASVDMENQEIIYKQYVNLGVAVDTDRGLVVPVIREVDQMSIPRIAAALVEVAEKARGGQLTLDSMRGSTFTISNLGAIGGTYSTPIINHPDVAILLVGRSRKMPIVVDDKMEVRLMMPLSLSYDHRLVDGAAAARFLNEVMNYLKVPGRLLLAP